MKTPEQISGLLKTFESRYGLSLQNSKQGSEAWFQAKLGVVSASCASDAVAKIDSQTRANYIADLAAQVATGVMEEIDSKHMAWGSEHEAGARSMYEFQEGVEIVELPFVFKDDTFRVGISPDGLVKKDGLYVRPIECKCPWNTMHYVRFMTDEKIKPEYIWQAQFQMWVLEAENMDFVQFDPRMNSRPLHKLGLLRDEEKMKIFEDKIPRFIEDMDRVLAEIGLDFGSQWTRIANAKQQEQAV